MQAGVRGGCGLRYVRLRGPGWRGTAARQPGEVGDHHGAQDVSEWDLAVVREDVP